MSLHLPAYNPTRVIRILLGIVEFVRALRTRALSCPAIDRHPLTETLPRQATMSHNGSPPENRVVRVVPTEVIIALRAARQVSRTCSASACCRLLRLGKPDSRSMTAGETQSPRWRPDATGQASNELSDGYARCSLQPGTAPVWGGVTRGRRRITKDPHTLSDQSEYVRATLTCRLGAAPESSHTASAVPDPEEQKVALVCPGHPAT